MAIATRLAPVALIAMLSACNFSFSTSSEMGNGPQNAARTFLKRVASDGAGAAYAADASPEMRAAVSPGAFRAFAAVFGLNKFQSAIFDKTEPAPNGGTLLTGTLNEQGMLGMPLKMRMAQQGDGWKVVSIDINKPPVMRIGEAAREPGLAPGVKFAGSDEVARACTNALASVRVPLCAHAIPLTMGASTECFGNQGTRAVGVTATIDGNNPVTGAMRVDCQVVQ